MREVERECLSETELNALAAKEFPTQRLEQVRDIFFFCCFTGLAYSDVKKLSRDHIIMGIDGEKWFKINRTKTDTRSSIPLLPIPAGIIEKYSNNPKCKAENRLLPVLTNQKMNGYLKELADLQTALLKRANWSFEFRFSILLYVLIASLSLPFTIKLLPRCIRSSIDGLHPPRQIAIKMRIKEYIFLIGLVIIFVGLSIRE
ncbi:MAG: hypothetical protein C5B59_01850 [Bacteroidetes bacterium]|nr:MAG: hypothetical protein C5B59_01850 [Bacteroidota bacterium]